MNQDTLIEENKELKKINQDLTTSITGLEKQLEEHTVQLKEANKELESFSYSVSHDLRAPLRVIDGFSQVLLDEYEKQLDEQAKTYLQRIRSNVARMAQLINDLLNLSRVSYANLNLGTVDLSLLASSTIKNLQESESKRKVSVNITPGLIAKGDARLLGVVLENLLGNAWKFTSKQEDAKIEFGVITVEGGETYFIKDNGAGFDMKYVDKLFGVFQRLHAAEEYPGTGVGLAIAARIIRRHNGRIWAEATVNQGATFYFDLAKI